MKRDEDQAIIAEAARRLADDLCRDGDPAPHALRTWQTLDPRHAARLAEMEAIWDDLGAVAAPAAALLPPTVSPRRTRFGRAAPRRIAAASGALAATIAFAVLADAPLRLQADLRTNVGERRLERLADGSRIWLDTDSAVAVDVGDARRVVRLLRGRAAFAVAPDRRRPFIVEAGTGATTALGTRFIVRRDGDTTDVTVTEHAVRVTLQKGVAVRLTEGHSVGYHGAVMGKVRTTRRDAASAWTRGWLVFDDAPLGTVIAEIARYHPGMIRLLGLGLANRRVSGSINVDNPDDALRAIESLLHLRATRIGSIVIFLHR